MKSRKDFVDVAQYEEYLITYFAGQALTGSVGNAEEQHRDDITEAAYMIGRGMVELLERKGIIHI